MLKIQSPRLLLPAKGRYLGVGPFFLYHGRFLQIEWVKVHFNKAGFRYLRMRIKRSGCSCFFNAPEWQFDCTMAELSSTARKRDKERDRVRKIGIEYQSLSDMLGLHPKKQNKVLTLKAALQFIEKNYEGLSTLVPQVNKKMCTIYCLCASFAPRAILLAKHRVRFCLLFCRSLLHHSAPAHHHHWR